MHRRFLLLAAVALAAGLPRTADSATALDFAFATIEGAPLDLAAFRGKAVLVVNTASFCGYTPQYAGLQKLWERYRERGLVVLGVPSNDFGQQEPGSAVEIKRFCEVNYSIDFPLTEKVAVTGAAAHPFYRWAAAELGAAAAPRWNFHKYLVGPDGRLVAWFPTRVAPDDPPLVQAIEAAVPR
ncbi:MAG: glutathione peroxidase [Alphaproteobacteria bacterium]|nr:glutathione peroxidase [Alphaproteobacteria bacterium]